MKRSSTDIIRQKTSNLDFVPMPYSHGDWFISKLLELGFTWSENTPPHFRLFSGNLKCIVSPYPNVVILDKHERSFTHELYCHPSIPQNEPEFDEFFNNIKHLI